MKITMFAAAGLLAFPLVGHAQDISGAVTLGYSNSSLSDGGGDFSTPTLDARLMTSFDSFSLGMRVDVQQPEDSDVTASLIGVEGAYRFANDMSFGAYVEQEELSGNGDSLSLSSYGLTAGFERNGMDFQGYFGQSDSDLLPANVDMTTLGFSAKYQVAPKFTLGGNYARTQISDGTDSVDISSIGVAAVFQVTEDFAAFGGYVHNSIDNSDLSIDSFGIGASYDMTKVTNFPMVVSLEAARTEAEGANMDSIRFGLTIPFGKSGSKAPLNSLADTVFDPSRSVVSSFLNTTF